MTYSTFPKNPKKYTIKEAIKIVTRCAKVYDQELKNRNLLFVYMVNDNVCYYEVSFYSTSYMHLTGLKSATSSQSATFVTNGTGKNSNGLSPEKFYQNCLDNKLNAKDIAFPGGFSTPYTFLKLDVIESVINKNLSAIAIGDFPTHKTLWADFAVGNDTACLAFVCKKGSNGGYVPISLLNGSYIKNIQNPAKILITYRKNMADQKYSEIVYVGKDANGNDLVDWDTICFTGQYAYLPKPV